MRSMSRLESSGWAGRCSTWRSARAAWNSATSGVMADNDPAARFRGESRGLHYNLDHPTRDDVHFAADTLIQRGEAARIRPS